MTASQASILNQDRTLGAGYKISLSSFNGPLDLLLQLVERQELDISEVSLCAVTDQYLSTLEGLAEVEPASLADFLAVASRLLYIKSNSLLPRPAEDEDEQEDVGDALVRQLIEYRRFRQVAEKLKSRTDSGQRAHVRPVIRHAPERRQATPPDLSDVDAQHLQTVLREALQRIPVEPPAPRVMAYRITVSEQIERVRRFVRDFKQSADRRSGGRVLFSSVLGTAYTRTEVIVTFLAILELIKQQELAVEQDGTFGEIYLLPVEGDS